MSLQIPAVGRKVIFRTGHPHQGKTGTVVGWQPVMCFPERGDRPVVRLESGTLCMITDLERDWRYAMEGRLVLPVGAEGAQR